MPKTRISAGTQMIRYVKNYHLFFIGFCFNVSEGLLFIILANYGGVMTNAIIAGNRAELLAYFIRSLFYTAAVLVSITAKEYFYARYLESGVEKIRRKTFACLLGARQEWLDGVHNAEITSNVSNDINALSNSARPFFNMCFSVEVSRIMAVVYLFAVNPLLTAVILCLVPFITLLQWKITKSVKSLQKGAMEQTGKMVSAASDCFTYREVIKAMSLEKALFQKFCRAQDEQYRCDVKSKWVSAVGGTVGFLSTRLPLIVVILISGLLILGGGMTVGAMMVFVTLSSSAARVLAGISDFFVRGQTVLACAERVTRLWQIPRQAASEGTGSGTGCAPRDGSIRFENVCFGYGGAADVLSRCSFSIRDGETVCLQGESGCGKSTVMKLICG